MANSAGLRAYHRSTQAEIHTTVLGDDGSGWAQATSDKVGDIDAVAVAGQSLDIAKASMGPGDLEPGKYTVVLRPAAVEEMIPYYMICDAKATDEGRTHLREKLGTKICDDCVSIRSDPTDPLCPGSPFQGDGLVAAKRSWIDAGVLKYLTTSRYWAQQKGREATSYPTNLSMDGGEKTVEELVAATERGVLVTRL